MAESLSRSEVEALLAGLRFESGHASPETRHEDSAPRRSRTECDPILILAETFGRVLISRISEAISSLTGARCSARLSHVESKRCEQFHQSLEGPAGFATLHCQHAGTILLLELGPGAAFPVVDLLLGGGAVQGHVPSRPLTEIELRLAKRAAEQITEAISLTDGFCGGPLEVVQFESRPPLVPLAAPDHSVMSIQVDTVLEDCPGQITLSFAERTASQLLDTDALLQDSEVPDRQSQFDPADVVVRIPASALTGEDLTDLKTGDVLMTHCRADEPVQVLIDGVPTFVGSVGVVQGRKAVRLQQNAESAEG